MRIRAWPDVVRGRKPKGVHRILVERRYRLLGRRWINASWCLIGLARHRGPVGLAMLQLDYAAAKKC